MVFTWKSIQKDQGRGWGVEIIRPGSSSTSLSESGVKSSSVPYRLIHTAFPKRTSSCSPLGQVLILCKLGWSYCLLWSWTDSHLWRGCLIELLLICTDIRRRWASKMCTNISHMCKGQGPSTLSVLWAQGRTLSGHPYHPFIKKGHVIVTLWLFLGRWLQAENS